MRAHKAIAIVVAAVTGIAVGVVGPAQAAPARTVVHGIFDPPAEEFDDPDTCASFGFAFHVVQDEKIVFEATFDKSGALITLLAHHDQRDTFTANGKTLVEADHWTNIFHADGSVDTVGNHARINGTHGVVLLDAGRLVEATPHGDVIFAAGPHPQYLGATFCPWLV